MLYAGWEIGFRDWLLMAEAAPVEPLPPPVETVLRPFALPEVKCCFWPGLTNGREPDLALLLNYDSGPSLLVLVEAKYRSGMSDDESDVPESEDGRMGDQILNQVRGMEMMSSHELLDWFDEGVVSPDEPTGLRKMHLLVTAHTKLPSDIYERSVSKRRHPYPPCYWLSWTTLADCLEACLGQLQGGQRALIDDLFHLLYRKGLVRFRGFDRTARLALTARPSFWEEQWWSERPWHVGSTMHSFWRKSWWDAPPWRSSLANLSFWEDSDERVG